MGGSDWTQGEKDAWAKRRKVDMVKFELADKSKDNSLNSMEIVAYLFPESDPKIQKFTVTTTFEAFDRDNDHRLTLQEYLAGDQHVPADIEVTTLEEKEFEFIDMNGDGFLDVVEFNKQYTGMFEAEHAMKIIML